MRFIPVQTPIHSGLLTVTFKGHTHDLIHSVDDGGWYFQRWKDDRVSQLFESRTAAIDAMTDGKVRFSA